MFGIKTKTLTGLNFAHLYLATLAKAGPIALWYMLCSSSVFAQAIPQIEWEKRFNADYRLTSFGTELMGDGIDPHTGTIAFSHTDVTLPGNSRLPVEIRRTRSQGFAYEDGLNVEFGDWEIDVPKISVTSVTPWTGNRCTTPFAQAFPDIPFDGRIMPTHEYSNGVQMAIPGEPSQTLLENPTGPAWPSDAYFVTRHNWYFSCGVASDGGHALIGRSPDGTIYKFDRYISRAAQKNYTKEQNSPDRTVEILAASEVSDVHGNWVRYDYDGLNRLTRIDSNDSRSITVNYSGSSKLITSISANGRTWNYAYARTNFHYENWTRLEGQRATNQVLTSVTQPDGRAWAFDLDGMFKSPRPADDCPNTSETIVIDHPYGVKGTFQLNDLKHRYVSQSSITGHDFCPVPYDDEIFAGRNINFTRVFGVIQKELQYTGGATARWTFQYGGPSQTVNGTNWTKVSAPDQHITYYHNWLGTDKRGDLVKKEIRETASGSPVRTETYQYQTEANIGAAFPGSSAAGFMFTGQRAPSRTISVSIEQSGDTFSTAMSYETNQASQNYSWGQPVRIDETTSTTQETRYEEITYSHRTDKWILSLPTIVKRNGKEFDRNAYNNNGLLNQTKMYGSVFRDYTYHPDGTLASVSDGLARTTSFGSYKRGIPQSVTLRDASSISRTVDNNGWVTSETNPRGFSYGYSYNPMGWLTAINRPGAWANTSIAYSVSSTGVTQTSTRGAIRSIVTYDSYLRPVRQANVDLTGAASTRYVKSSFDEVGREVFRSFPSHSSDPSTGVRTSYDALSRVISTDENVAPYAVVNTAYLSGNRVRITHQDNGQTMTTYRAFGAPATDEVMQVVDPTGTTTIMTRDIYGNVVDLHQSSVHNGFAVNVYRKFWYDGRLRLCRHRAPEFGDELFTYDNADQLIYKSRGESSGSGCATPSASLRTGYQYDPMGRETLIDFPSGSTDISKTYDGNGNLQFVTRGGIKWTYNYDGLDQIELEKLEIDGLNFYIGHAYESDGRQKSIQAPFGAITSFNPDGFGQPTSLRQGATNFVSNVNYFPNGIVQSATYGNGSQLVQTIDSRQLLQTKSLSVGGVEVSDGAYQYNKKRQITSIVGSDIGGTTSFSYDLSGRLVRSDGNYGALQYFYDGLGNIRRKQYDAWRDIDISYNASTNQVSEAAEVVDSAAMASFTGQPGATGSLRPAYEWNAGTSEFVYDGNLKRVKTTVDGDATYWVYSAVTGTPIFSWDTASNTRTQYLSGGGAQVRLKDGVATYTHLDHVASPTVALDSAGTILWRERYFPFGEKRLDPQQNKNAVGYTGHVQDDASGLTYMQARYFDPVIGRFLSTDPIGYQDQLNLYAYVHNDPVNMVDPDGRQAGRIWKVVKIGWNKITGKKSVKDGVVDEVIGIGDDLGTLANGQAEWGDLGALADLAVGTDLNNPKTKTANRSSKLKPPSEREVDIYEVPGSGTPSGQPYVGSGLTEGNRRTFTGDGRDRSQSTLVERVPESQRRTAEQRAMNERGGVSNLDNKRNEVRESCWPECGIDPPD